MEGGQQISEQSSPSPSALIDSEDATELELIARQIDLAMFFAMNESGPLSAGRRFSPPLSCERGGKQW
jgi:hypothetical protein